jgi:hypothetical protein
MQCSDFSLPEWCGANLSPLQREAHVLEVEEERQYLHKIYELVLNHPSGRNGLACLYTDFQALNPDLPELPGGRKFVQGNHVSTLPSASESVAP